MPVIEPATEEVIGELAEATPAEVDAVVVIGTLIPELFFAKFGTFLAFLGAGFAPLCGIQVADYFLRRRRHVSLLGIYEGGPAGPFAYTYGFNPAAVIALALGCAVYMALLNPLTFTSHGPYRFLTASLPAAIAAAVVYLVVSRLGRRSGRVPASG